MMVNLSNISNEKFIVLFLIIGLIIAIKTINNIKFSGYTSNITSPDLFSSMSTQQRLNMEENVRLMARNVENLDKERKINIIKPLISNKERW